MPAANPRRWAALAVIALAQFMVTMDTSIIGVALPEIQTDLGFSPGDLSWVFNAYVVAFGGLLLLRRPALGPLRRQTHLHRRLGDPGGRLARRRPGGQHGSGDRRSSRPRRRCGV